MRLERATDAGIAEPDHLPSIGHTWAAGRLSGYRVCVGWVLQRFGRTDCSERGTDGCHRDPYERVGFELTDATTVSDGIVILSYRSDGKFATSG